LLESLFFEVDELVFGLWYLEHVEELESQISSALQHVDPQTLSVAEHVCT
jgi:hypothetical protein